LPGPTGESNRLTTVARAPVLCLGPTDAAAAAQAAALRDLGGQAVEAPRLEAAVLARTPGISGAIWWGDAAGARAYATALAGRAGPILPLIGGAPDAGHARLERHVCIDTTASGGNAQLLVEAAEV
jgi:RHH-type proline utilization regulon transcriptional repressor/proline dehydrogenase/delta 1-pyrroline-5-carboxylate dehydrogenase